MKEHDRVDEALQNATNQQTNSCTRMRLSPSRNACCWSKVEGNCLQIFRLYW